MTAFSLTDFVRESNRIERIEREPLKEEIVATQNFLGLETLTITDVVKLVAVYQPGARPRFAQGLDVQVGEHAPLRGGPHVQKALQQLLEATSDGELDAYKGHVAYLSLHPFTDGNGRSGRAIWLWAMGGMERAPLGFLHHFYYQSLRGSAATSPGERS
jgi:Fic/DOC family